MATQYTLDDTYVQGDTGPDIQYLLRDIETGDPLDLTGATVYFQMRKPDDRRYQVNALATIDDDPTSGKVRYVWQPNDLSVSGLYQLQWETHLPEGKEMTSKYLRYIEVRKQ